VKVELSFDQGENWVEASIRSPSMSYEISRWDYNWQVKMSGHFSIVVRASDSSGNIQPKNSIWNKGGYGNNVAHQIEMTVN
jgi:hypothetical protein